MHGGKYHDPLAAQLFVHATEDLEITIDLSVPRRLQQFGHLEHLLLGRPLEVEQLAHGGLAGVGRNKLITHGVAEFPALQVIDPIEDDYATIVVESQLVLVIRELKIRQVVPNDRLTAVAFRPEAQPCRPDVALCARKCGPQYIDEVVIETLAKSLLDLLIDQAQPEDTLQHVIPIDGICKSLERIFVQVGDDVLKARAKCLLAFEFGASFRLARVLLRERRRQREGQDREQADLD